MKVANSRKGYFSAVFHNGRLLGPQKVRVAKAKEMLVIIGHMLTNNEAYRTMNEEMVGKK